MSKNFKKKNEKVNNIIFYFESKYGSSFLKFNNTKEIVERLFGIAEQTIKIDEFDNEKYDIKFRVVSSSNILNNDDIIIDDGCLFIREELNDKYFKRLDWWELDENFLKMIFNNEIGGFNNFLVYFSDNKLITFDYEYDEIFNKFSFIKKDNTNEFDLVKNEDNIAIEGLFLSEFDKSKDVNKIDGQILSDEIFYGDAEIIRINVDNFYKNFLVSDFICLLGIVENNKEKDFIIDFKFDRDEFVRWRAYLFYLNYNTSNAVFLCNNATFIYDSDFSIGNLVPLLKFRNDDNDLDKFLQKRGSSELFSCVDEINFESDFFCKIRSKQGSKKEWLIEHIRRINVGKTNPVKFYLDGSKVDLETIIDTTIVGNLFDSVKFLTLACGKDAGVDEKKKFAKEINTRVSDLPAMQSLIATMLIASYAEDRYFDMQNLSIQFEKIIEESFDYATGINELIENTIRHARIRQPEKEDLKADGFFSLRIHQTGDSGNDLSRDVRSINKRKHLKNKYLFDAAKSENEGKELFKSSIVKSYKYHLELQIFDFGKQSISETFSERIAQNSGKNLNEVRCHFSGFFNEDRLVGDHLDFVSKSENAMHHYGIRLFARSVLSNGGYFIAQSKGEMREEYGLKLDSKTIELDVNPRYEQVLNGSIFSVLLPIGFTRFDDGVNAVFDGGNIYGIEYIDKKIKVIENVGKELIGEIDRFSAKILHTFSQDDKIDKINEFGKILYENISAKRNSCLKDGESVPIIQIELGSLKLDKIEAFCKAFLKCIIMRHDEKRERKKKATDLYALVWSENSNNIGQLKAIKKFAKFFSIFYLQGKQDAMKNVQIAIINKGNKDSAPSVKFMIVGDKIESFYNVAKLFTYNNPNVAQSSDCLGILSAIKWVPSAKNDTALEEVENLFPFDLIPNLGRSEDAQNSNETPSFFIRDLENMFFKKIQEKKDFGVKLEDVYFYVNYIRMKDFYAIDLPFNNLSKIYKLSYLIAQEVIAFLDKSQELESNRPLLLVGHRQYNSINLQQVQKFVQDYFDYRDKVRLNKNSKSSKEDDFIQNKKMVYLALVNYCKSRNQDRIFDPSYDLEEKLDAFKREKLINNDVFDIVFVEPINALTNNFKEIETFLKDELRKKYYINQEKDSLGKVAVVQYPGKKYFDCYIKHIIKKNLNEISGDEIKKIKKDVEAKSFIQIDDIDIDEDIQSDYKYYFDKVNVLDEKLFVKVKREISRLGHVFELKGRKMDKTLSNNTSNNDIERKLDSLSGCLINAHVERNENHYLFYVDTEKYYNKEKDKIKEWLNKCRSDLIDINKKELSKEYTFNLIVAPQHTTNSEFVKSVAENVFAHNLKFIYFPLGAVNREGVRAQLSYITEDVRGLIDNFSSVNINAYYVDDRITSGRSIMQTKSLLQMLFDEALDDGELPKNKQIKLNLFSGIFTLVNNRNKKNLTQFIDCNCQCDSTNSRVLKIFSYLDLKIKGLKTRNLRCPSCDVQDDYLLLSKMSSTNRLNDFWKKCLDKNEIRNYKEYDTWFNEKLENANWDGDSNEGSANGYLKWYEQEIHLSGCSDSIHKEKREKIEYMKNDVLQRRYLSRLKATHYSVEKLEFLFLEFEGKSRNEINFITKHNILELICEKVFYNKKLKDLEVKIKGDFNDIEESEEEKLLYKKEVRKQVILCFEGLISYIKVLSRPPMSKYHHIGQAVLTILLEIIEFCFSGAVKIHDKSLDVGGKYKEKLEIVCSYMVTVVMKKGEYKDRLVPFLSQFQLFNILLKRLANLGSLYLLRSDKIDKIIDYWFKLKDIEKSQENDTGYNDKHSLSYYDVGLENSFVFQFCSYVKWLIDARSDNVLCCEFDGILKSKLDNFRDKKSNCLGEKDRFKLRLLMALYMENVQHLYRETSDNYKKWEATGENLNWDAWGGKQKWDSSIFAERKKVAKEILTLSINAQERERLGLYDILRKKKIEGIKNRVDDGRTTLDDLDNTIIISNRLVKSFSMCAKSDNDIFYHVATQGNADRTKISNRIYQFTRNDKSWILDTFIIDECEIFDEKYVVLKIPYHVPLKKDSATGLSARYVYMYLEFSKKTSQIDILDTVRNILFLRMSLERTFIRYAPEIFSMMNENVDRVSIVKEIYQWITMHGKRRTSKLKELNEKEDVIFAINHVEKLLENLSKNDFHFKNELIEVKKQLNIFRDEVESENCLSKTSNLAKKIAKYLTIYMSKDYYIPFDEFGLDESIEIAGKYKIDNHYFDLESYFNKEIVARFFGAKIKLDFSLLKKEVEFNKTRGDVFFTREHKEEFLRMLGEIYSVSNECNINIIAKFEGFEIVFCVECFHGDENLIEEIKSKFNESENLPTQMEMIRYRKKYKSKIEDNFVNPDISCEPEKNKITSKIYTFFMEDL